MWTSDKFRLVIYLQTACNSLKSTFTKVLRGPHSTVYECTSTKFTHYQNCTEFHKTKAPYIENGICYKVWLYNPEI